MDGTRTFLRTAVLWAMLPLTVLSGAPRFVCLCSTGEFKLFCSGTAAAHLNGGGEGAQARHVRSVHRSCCHRSGLPVGSNPTCREQSCRCTLLVGLPDAPLKCEAATAPHFEVATIAVHHAGEAWPHAAQVTTVSGDLSPAASNRELLCLLSRLVI